MNLLYPNAQYPQQQQQYAQPQQYAPQQQYAQPPQQQAFAPTQQLNAQQVAIALAGLSESADGNRYPYLPVGTHHYKIKKVEFKNTAYGLKLFIEGEVLESSVPEIVGSIHSAKISGYDKMTQKTYALMDTKSFMLGTLVHHGLTREYAGDWISMLMRVIAGNGFNDIKVYVQTFMHQSPKTQNWITKFNWAVAPQG